MPNLLDWGQPAPETPVLPESEPAVTAAAVRQPKGPRTGRTNPGRRQGEHGTGPRKFTPADVSAVYAVLRGTTPEAPISVSRIGMAANLNGRTVRSILSERDGIDFLVGSAPSGELFDASVAVGAAEGFSEKLRSQIVRMAERVNRRQTFMDATRAAALAE